MSDWQFNFQTESWKTIATLLLIGVALTVSFMAWIRSKRSIRVALMELLRFLSICVATLALWQPELVRTIVPSEKSTIAVLIDQSSSMLTNDVDGSNNDEKIAREQAVEPLLIPTTWNVPDSNMEFVIEPFSALLSDKGDTRSTQGTDIHDALRKAIERHPNLRAVVLASDGDWNMGAHPNTIANWMRMRNIPIHSVAIGSPTRLPDHGIDSFEVPTFAVVGKPLRIPFSITSSIDSDTDVEVELYLGDQSIERQQVRVPMNGIGTGTLAWRPNQVGDEKLTLKIKPRRDDAVIDNNVSSVQIAIRQESLRVLLIESYPRWEYRYLRNALERDPGVDVECHLLHPEIGELGGGRGYLDEFPSDDQLARYDVIFLGDIGVGPNGLSDEQCRRIRSTVESQATGLVFMPGMKGNQSSLVRTSLSDLLPIEYDMQQPRGVGSSRSGQFRLSDLGRSSLLTRLEASDEANEQVWKSLPGFYWYAAVDRVRPGGQVLATHDRDSTRTGRVPLIVTKTFGNGKILYMGSDGAWRWRKGVEDRYHYRFWGQVVRWMAYQRTMSSGDSMRLFYSPDRPKEEETMTLQVNAMTATGEPLQSGTITSTVKAPSGKDEAVQFRRASDESWGLFVASFRPMESGDYTLETKCAETGAVLRTTIPVAGVQRERIGMPARPEVLEEISLISRGKCRSIEELNQIVSDLAQLAMPKPIESRLQLWCHPVWGATIIALLGLFWTLRKMGGWL